MLKSLFEASIDTLHIPAEMKTAIKNINNICLEAEGDEKDPARQRNQPQAMDFNNPSSYNVFPQNAAPAAQPAKQQTRQPQVPKGTTRAPNQVRTSGPAANGQQQVQQQVSVDPARQRNQPQAMDFNNPSSYNVFPQPSAPAAQPAKQQAPQQAQPQVPKGMTREPAQVRTSGPASNGQPQGQPQQQAPQQQQTRQPQVPKGMTREPGQVRTSGPIPQGQAPVQPQQKAPQQPQVQPQQQAQPQQQQQPQLRKGADVATVQYFLNSRNPNLKLATDGVLGPNTIKAIQTTEDINATGKMDTKTNEAFNLLLNEAKKKVQAAQSKLGVSQDGLIGKQTLAALNNAKMNVSSIFTGNPTAQTNAQQQTNLTANQFDEAKAQQALKSNHISQQEYNIWKTYGIAPVYQRQKPQETQAQIAKMQQAKNGQPQQVAQQNQSSNVMTTNGPRNDAEKKFFEQTKANYEKIYTQPMNDKDLALQKADQAARVALAKKQKGEWAKEGQAALDKVIANMGNNNQTQNAAQPQQVAQQNKANPAQQKGTEQPVNQTTPQKPQAQPQAQPQQQNPKAPQGSTQYMSGKVSYMNLPPDEKKVYDDAEKKAQAEYIKKGNNEQTAYEKAQMNAQVAVLRYRQKKGNKS